MPPPRSPAPLTTPALVLLALVVPLLAASTPAAAQLDLPCLNCAVTIETVAWNGTGAPGTIVGGTFRISNTGETQDSYTINVSVDDPAWIAESDEDTFEDVPAGAGLFASEDNTRDLNVSVLIPQGVASGATASITITVQSQSQDDLSDSTTAAATADQVRRWALSCTPDVTVKKTEKTTVTLTATNQGNGPDGATITLVAPPVGISAQDPENVQATAGGSDNQSIDIGIGLRIEDGDYTLRWDLRSTGDRGVTASCTTTLTVTGGTGGDGGDDGDGGTKKDSPGPVPALVITALALVVLHARRRHA